jgi:hypothetical protein
MSKNIAEQSNSLSIFWLKKHGYLNREYSSNYGGIKWTYGGSSEGSNINFRITRDDWGTTYETTHINLIYTHTDYWTKEKADMDSRIELDTTPCRYGGIRYWFICPLTKNGKYCGRRVGVLFSIGKWFGCRHCADIAYAKQMEGGKYRWNGVSIPDIERAEKEVKRMYYKGKPTRKHRRLMRLNENFEMGWVTMASKLDRKFRGLK